MTRSTIALLGLLALLPVAATTARAQAPDDKPPPDQVIDLGGVTINRSKQFVEVQGHVALDRGLVELFACTPEGKAYESILVLKCRADMLQTGLLFLGLERGTSGRHAGDKIRTKGSPVVILATWTDPVTKTPVRRLAEDLVWDHRASKPMKRVGWVFVGSRFATNPQSQREVFMASVTGTLVVTYHDPDAILDTPHDAGVDDSTFYANHYVLPPRGTALVMRIYAQKAYDALPAAEQALPAPTAPAGDGAQVPPANGSGSDTGRPPEGPAVGSGSMPTGPDARR